MYSYELNTHIYNYMRFIQCVNYILHKLLKEVIIIIKGFFFFLVGVIKIYSILKSLNTPLNKS